MKRFYDAHCHMMNLSHPNLSVMIRRVFKELRTLDRLKISLGTFLFAVMGKAFPALFKVDDRAMNLLAIMETELGDYILQMEEDLVNNLRWGNGPEISGSVGSIRYDKMVLTPLIMDFGLKNDGKSGTFYKVRWKPIVSQMVDLCLGLKHYYKHRDAHPLSSSPLFEVYPFMGINTRNYDMDSKPDGTVGLKELLSKNFDGFDGDTPEQRYSKISARDWREFKGDIDSIAPYAFVGIKVYPPLGFNPWPTETWEIDVAEEMRKASELYSFCQRYRIPITAHCSDGGFLIDKQYEGLANPDKWAAVLNDYPNIRLNLAHFGADNAEWRKAISRLMIKYDNVYTDISYRGVDKEYYFRLREFIENHTDAEKAKLMSRIIFGSDFMINLMNIESYGKYMEYFSETKAFTAGEKDMFCSRNPEAFLYMSAG